MTEPDSEPTPPIRELTVRKLSKLWNVTVQCVHKWRNTGRIKLHKREEDDRWVAQEDEARAAKVLREADAKRWLAARGVPETRLDLAVHVGLVTAEARETNGEDCFSIDDVELVERTYREQREGDDDNTPPDAPPIVSDLGTGPDADDTRDRRRALLDYLENGRSPCELPTWFWDTPAPPTFVPPLNVFHYEFAARRMNDAQDSFVTEIKRSAGYTRNEEGKLVFAPESPSFDLASELHAAGTTPPWLEHENRMYELAREDWFELVRLHGQPTIDKGPGAHDKRDREATIRKYIAARGRPCDLPDWFWDVPEMPPFVPPMQVFWYQCGEQFVHEGSGRTMTYMMRSEGWGEFWTGSDAAPEPHFMPFDAMEFPVDGAYPPGAVPAEFAEDNWRYQVARQEWEAEWRRRRG